MVERHVWFDAGVNQCVNEVVVPFKSILINAISYLACRHYPRPSDAEPIMLEAHGLHQGYVCVHHVIAVTSNVARGTLNAHGGIHWAGCLLATVAAVGTLHAHRVCAGKRVPNRCTTSILIVGALDLIGSSAQTPDEAFRQVTRPCVLRRPLPRVIGERVLVGTSLVTKAFFIANLRPGDRGYCCRERRAHRCSGHCCWLSCCLPLARRCCFWLHGAGYTGSQDHNGQHSHTA
mmetsp:Transcript_38005/g.73054  ORF Transcript_38005/g.73054 Transcript_38005/m.73054 type:complete len:233 (-) Transcript_38005:157-855(-)